MAAYWLCITNEVNWKVIREKNTWGVSDRHKNTIAKINPDDKLVIYVKQGGVKDDIVESRIVSVYEVVSELFRNTTRTFSSKGIRINDETFP